MRLARALVLFAALGLPGMAAATTAAHTDYPLDGFALHPHLELLEDPDRSFTIEQVTTPPLSDRFEHPDYDTNAMGYSESAWWIRFRTDNRSTSPVTWYLDMAYAPLDKATLFEPTGPGQFGSTAAGDQVPHDQWPIPYRTAVFPVHEPPGAHTYHVRVQTTSPLNLRLALYSPQAFEIRTRHVSLFLWIYYGLMIGMVLYNLFLYISVRDRSYLYYVLYVVPFCMFMLVHNGLAFQYLWPGATTWASDALLYAGYATITFAVAFGRSFLATKRNTPRIDKVLVVLLLAQIPILLATLLGYYPIRIGSAVLIPTMLLLWVAGILALKRGYRPARFYVLAWTALIVGILLGLLNAFGLLPNRFFADWGYQIASAIEAVLLSLALADRINSTQAELALLNTKLEATVETRTASLREANVELASANEQLREEIEGRKRAQAEQVRLEEQLMQSQKLEALGRLAGGVAHDMNNVLGGVMGYASILIDQAPAEAPERTDLEGIIAAAERGRELTRNLLGFARRGKYQRQQIAVKDALEEVRLLLERTIDKKIQIEILYGPDIPEFTGDPAQIIHALMNLCLNAAYAMPDGGTLTIKTDSAALSDWDLFGYPDLAPGRYILLEIRDTGTGMDADTLEHAFEPFFTTKSQGAGTGLGLSMVYGTIRNHGGGITLQSETGRGTTATIVLPAAESVTIIPETLPEKPKAVAAGTRSTILLVDDDAMIREIGKRLLEGMGHEVLLAVDGAEAVSCFKDHRQRIGLVLLDMVMPVMEGAEAFEQMRIIDPEVRVLVVSGYSTEVKAEEVMARGAVGFLPKPFDADSLSAAVNEALGVT